MDLNRVHNILTNTEKVDVFYNQRPVWIQSIHNNKATVGFVDNFEEANVLIDDLYE